MANSTPPKIKVQLFPLNISSVKKLATVFTTSWVKVQLQLKRNNQDPTTVHNSVNGRWYNSQSKTRQIKALWDSSTRNTHTHTRLTALCPGLPRWAGTRKAKTKPDFTEARDSEWQWHPLGHMHVCTSIQADNHASTPSLSFLQAGCPSCCPTNSVKALKAFKALNFL